MNSTSYLQMLGISKSYDGTQALHDVDFTAEIGEVHAIVGENGAGKTTLVKILSGAIPQDRGDIFVNEKIETINTPHGAFALGIRAVYQEFSLVPHLTVAENILLGQMPTGRTSWWVDWNQANARAEEILEDIGFTGINGRTPVSQLSVSQQQMVEIAKAVAQKPNILILDEPSAVLSQEELNLLFAVITKLKQESTLILYISHRLDEVFTVADQITVLRDGELVRTVSSEETNEGELIRMMVGRKLDEIYPLREASYGEEILSVKSLNYEKSFSDISFSINRREILGLFGLVGSGRTQLARCIFGAETPSSGEIFLNRSSISIRSPKEAVQLGIALMTEDRKSDGLILSCTIRDNTILASMNSASRGILLNPKEQDLLVEMKVNELDIRPTQINRLVQTLSGGNQQKVVLAKWLLTEAEVLILDEPTRGVDVGTKVEIYHIIGDLADRGVAVLLISSELPEILGMSDRIIVMREGNLIGEFTRAEANEEKVLSIAAGIIQ